MKFKIVLFLEDFSYLESVLKDDYQIFVGSSKSSIVDFVTKHTASLVIVDYEFLTGKHGFEIKNDLLLYDLPIIAYAPNATNAEKATLYEIGAKAVIKKDDGKEDIATIVYDTLRRSNPYVGTSRDIFLKALIRYENLYDDTDYVLSIANYLIWHYRPPIKSAANIRATLMLLVIAFRKHNIRKIYVFVSRMNISKDILALIDGYNNPKNIEEKIILASLIASNIYADNFQEMLEIKNNCTEVLHEANEAILHTKIYISCMHDMYVFWENINNFAYEEGFDIEVANEYMYNLFNFLQYVLAEFGCFHTSIDSKSDDSFYFINIKPCQKPIHIHTLERFVKEEVETKNISITYFTKEDEARYGCIIVKINKDESLNKTKDSKALKRKKNVDTSVMESMHYTDDQKISAEEFLKEFELETALLDDLNDNEIEAQNILLNSDDLTPQMLEAFTGTLIAYTRLLNETIEFRDLAYSISALAEVLINANIEDVEDGTKATLKQYISGIIDDLSSWKDVVFIKQSTPDIHYLDASLLDNCSVIEQLFHPMEQNDAVDDDDDLEFF